MTKRMRLGLKIMAWIAQVILGNSDLDEKLLNDLQAIRTSLHIEKFEELEG